MIRLFRLIIRLSIKIQDCVRSYVYRHASPDTHQDRARRLTAPFLDSIPPGAVMLDIGAGMGHIAREMAEKKNAFCVCLDNKRLFFPFAPRPLVQCDGHRLGFKENVFDTVLMITTLHHCKDPRTVLQEARRVCRGRIIVIEDVFEGLGDLLKTVFLDGLINMEPIGHPHRFHSTKGWEKIFSDLELAIEMKKEFHFRLNKFFRFRNAMYVLAVGKRSP